MRCARLISLVILLVVGLPLFVARSVAAQPSDDAEDTGAFEDFAAAFDFAQNSYLYGDYGDVVATLAPRLLPEADTDVDEGILIRAYTMLGTAAHFESDGATADAAFLEVLLRDPLFQLDPLLYPPRVIERFERVRDDNAETLESLVEEVSAMVYLEHRIREQPRIVSMMPFGYGFFAADRDLTGVGYAVGEGALGAAMLGLYLSNEFARDSGGYFAEPERARNRGRAQLVLASAFTSLVLVNVIHGAVAHDSLRREDDWRVLDNLPPALEEHEDIGASGPRPRRGWRFSFAPLFAP